MNLQIKWGQGMAFTTTTPSGHDVTLDAAETDGGLNQGPRPTEMLLTATATCTGIDIVSILHKMRQPLVSFDLAIDGIRAEEHPKRFTTIHMLYRLEGELDEDKVRRAIQLSVEKYCSVSHSLNATLTYSYQLNGGPIIPFTSA